MENVWLQVDCLKKYLKEQEILSPGEVIEAQMVRRRFEKNLGWVIEFKLKEARKPVKKNVWLTESTTSEYTGIVQKAMGNRFMLCIEGPHNITEGKIYKLCRKVPSEKYLIQAMYDIRKLEGPQRAFRDLLLNRNPIMVDRQPELTFINSKLDISQKQAVSHCLSARVTVLQGPPGSGKTSTITEVLAQCRKGGKKVLMLAPSHSAVDNILGKMMKMDKRGLIRLGHPACTSFPEMCLANRAREAGNTEKDLLHSASVVFGTLAGCIKPVASMKKNHFWMTMVDEAGQCMECAVWSVVQYTNILVLAGDFQQLGPTIKSCDKSIRDILGRSMIERIANERVELIQTLSVQYRMSDDIMQWSNMTFYGGNLKSASSVANINLLSLPRVKFSRLPTKRTLYLIDTNGRKKECVDEGEGNSFYNPGESASVVKLIKRLLYSGVKQGQMGVISFYTRQINDIEARLKMKNIEHVEVKSVDSFQGREKEIIILSMVRSNTDQNIGFLKDPKRLNVSATRAKRLLVVVVDTKTFQHNEIFESFFKYLKMYGDVKIFG